MSQSLTRFFGDGPIDLVYAQGWLSNIEYSWENSDKARFLERLGAFARVLFFDRRSLRGALH